MRRSPYDAGRAGRDQAAADQVRPHGLSRTPGAITPKIVSGPLFFKAAGGGFIQAGITS